MSRKNKHSVDEVIRSLSRKRDCKISPELKVVEVLKGNYMNHDLGNGSWGKIDFLVNHNHYTLLKVNEFSR